MSGVEIKNLTRAFGDIKAVNDVSFTVPEKSFSVLLGPSGCGKSTLLRCMNRMNDLVDGVRLEGKLLLMNGMITKPIQIVLKGFNTDLRLKIFKRFSQVW